MANNIITAAYSSSNITYTKPAYQYDYGMILQFSGIDLPQAYEVHFSNTEFCGESISQIGDADGVTIPDEMFLNGNPIYAWTYLHTGEDDGETVYKAVISVNKRAKPSNLEPTPVQQDAITQAISALNVAVEQTAADVVAAGESAEAAAGSAETAGQAKDDAVEAKDKSVEAKNAAETAQGKAEDAQRAAEQAAGSVLGLTADATVDANVGTPSVEVDVTTKADHKKMSFAFHNLKGVQGDQGVGISSVVLNSDYTLTITLTNGNSYTTSSIRGEVGATPNLTIGTVSTLPEGSQATATITGTDEEPVLNLGIPVGDTGDPGISPTITVTEITGGHEVEVVDAQGTQTFAVMDGEVSEQDLEDALIDKADVITSTASGEIVTIADGANNLPVKNLSVSLLPVQDLHGYDNPWPAGGRKNLLPYPYSSVSGTYSGITFTKNEDGTVNCSGTASGTAYFNLRNTLEKFLLKAGTYIVNGNISGSVIVVGKAADNIAVGSTNVNNGQFTLSEDTEVFAFIQVNSGNSVNGIVKPMIRLATESDATYAPYTNICPISGWTGVEVYHSDADTSNPTTIPIDWSDEAGTVYGGSLDLTTGVMTVDTQSIQIDSSTTIKSSRTNAKGNFSVNYNLEDLGYPFGIQSATANQIICDKLIGNRASDIYNQGNANATGLSADGKSLYVMADNTITSVADYTAWMSNLGGITVLYPLATPLEYTLSETQIATFLGTNNFWSNGNGTLDLEYRCDTKLYIEQLTKPTEDDMIANANIASGKFFMVGNRLFLSTVAIAQGEQIVVGTNCTEVSLADALNQINA